MITMQGHLHGTDFPDKVHSVSCGRTDRQLRRNRSASTAGNELVDSRKRRHQVTRTCFKFKDFAEALAFTNKVGQIAEEEGHHPSILTEWGGVTVTWWTHKIKGLHRNDFIMAAKNGSPFASKKLEIIVTLTLAK